MEAHIIQEPILFYVDYPYGEDNKEEIQKLYQKYFSKGIIGFEVSKSGVKHLQSFVTGTHAQYYAFIAKWKSMYQKATGKVATGRATAGKRKNYGKVKNIKKDADSCIAYCSKDNNYLYWGYDKEYIEECNEISFSKVTDSGKAKRQRVVEHFKTFKTTNEGWSTMNYGDQVDAIEALMEKHFEEFGNILNGNAIRLYRYQAGYDSFRNFSIKYCNVENNIF